MSSRANLTAKMQESVDVPHDQCCARIRQGPFLFHAGVERAMKGFESQRKEQNMSAVAQNAIYR